MKPFRIPCRKTLLQRNQVILTVYLRVKIAEAVFQRVKVLFLDSHKFKLLLACGNYVLYSDVYVCTSKCKLTQDYSLSFPEVLTRVYGWGRDYFRTSVYYYVRKKFA